MKPILLFLGLTLSGWVYAQSPPGHETIVNIPLMERAGPHREYADALLALALESSEDRYGGYEIRQETGETVIRRQLLGIVRGDSLSVAVSMPSSDWLDNARLVPFPILKGLASYRLFLAHGRNLEVLNHIEDVATLKTFEVGQGEGWSTGKILEDHGFKVVYGGPYKTLFPMLYADRYQLLMRGVYEIAPELELYQPRMPELEIVDGFAIYTYLPMYFFVSRDQPQLAERLEYGLKKAHASGQLDALFMHYFSDTLTLLNLGQRRIFCLPNTNIDSSFYENDKPYLLEAINTVEAESCPSAPVLSEGSL